MQGSQAYENVALYVRAGAGSYPNNLCGQTPTKYGCLQGRPLVSTIHEGTEEIWIDEGHFRHRFVPRDKKAPVLIQCPLGAAKRP